MKSDQPVPHHDKRLIKPAPAPKHYDGLLDPLPVPDVSESDTDTAWGLWEASLGDVLPPGKAAPEVPAHHDYEPTQPSELDAEPPPPDKLR